jgi:hypothetical protein
MEHFILLVFMVAFLFILMFCGIISIPFRGYFESFLEKRIHKKNRKDWEDGFMAFMKHYYIDRMNIFKINTVYADVKREDNEYFFKGMLEASRIVKKSESKDVSL